MTDIYFVRHAQPDYSWKGDRSRPLSEDGLVDCKKVVETLKDCKIDYFLSSPYKRSYDTIKDSAKSYNKEILTDERFRERRRGPNDNFYLNSEKRWLDFSFCEEGGENLKQVQDRNIEALCEVLKNYKDKNIVIGTHGTALSTILNYYDTSFLYKEYLSIIDFKPYILKLSFNGNNYLGKQEILAIKKPYLGK